MSCWELPVLPPVLVTCLLVTVGVGLVFGFLLKYSCWPAKYPAFQFWSCEPKYELTLFVGLLKP